MTSSDTHTDHPVHKECAGHSHDDVVHHAHQAHHGGHGGNSLMTATHATLHCLTGCIIGELAGLVIGVTVGLPALATVILATVLSYVSGFTLGVLPVMKEQGQGFFAALKIIWIGEAVSIGVMEIVMNAVDYSMGGMNATHIFTWQFISGLLVAVPAGFIAAWPVNWWLLKRNLKACH